MGRVLHLQTFYIEWTGQDEANCEGAGRLLCLLGVFSTFCSFQNRQSQDLLGQE